jgi:hypothetical protein
MSRIVKASTAAAIVLAVAVAAYGLFLALVGMPVAVVQERVQGMEAPDGGVNIGYDPVPHAFIGVLAAAMILVGLLKQKLLIAWSGLVVLFAYSVLFLFSVGAGLLPVAVLLLILLIIIRKMD